MLVIFQFLPKTSFEKEHKYGNNHKENKKIRAIALFTPNPNSFEEEKCRYK